jgi:hypothetical protein
MVPVFGTASVGGLLHQPSAWALRSSSSANVATSDERTTCMGSPDDLFKTAR